MSGRTKGPNPIDIQLGHRLRSCRLAAGITQQALGAAVGVTFQQIQKYELGTNRISASRLVQFSRVLGVPVIRFFEGVEEFADAPRSQQSLYDQRPVDFELARRIAFVAPKVRRELLALVDALAAASNTELPPVAPATSPEPDDTVS
jgi:transcriptional regulator with XRE-family HTH domain